MAQARYQQYINSLSTDMIDFDVDYTIEMTDPHLEMGFYALNYG